MQQNKADEKAKEIIRDAVAVFKDKIEDIELSDATDEPFQMFRIKFVAYNYYVIVFNYDRGHFGCGIVFGEYAVSLSSELEWDDNCNYKAYWEEIEEQIRIRIPDKFLQARGWL